MAQTCGVCLRPDRSAIDAALAEPGRPGLRDLGTQFGVDWQMLRRHDKHRAGAPEAAPVSPTGNSGPEAGEELVRARSNVEAAESLVREAQATGSTRDVALALRLKIEADAALMQARGVQAPDWQPERDAVLNALRTRIVKALKGHPDALAAVRVAFGEGADE